MNIAEKKDFVKSWFLLIPSIVLIFIFLFLPLMYTLYLSFFDWNMIRPDKEFVGMKNYIDLFMNPVFYKVLKNTFLYILILAVVNCAIPYIFAFVCHFVFERFKEFYKIAIFMPAFISLVVGSMIFMWILNPLSGPLALLVRNFAITLPVWNITEGLVIVVISLITSWRVFGYNFIILYAAVSGIAPDVIEAAKLDNVPLYKVFKDIVMPMSSATGIYIFVITTVMGLQYIYTPISVLTKGGPNDGSSNLLYLSYHEAFVVFNSGNSAAISIVTIILFAIFIVILFKFVESRVHYENE